MRITPGPTSVAAEVDDFVNDIVRNDLIADLGNERQVDGVNEKIDGMTGNFEAVLVDDFILGTAENGID